MNDIKHHLSDQLLTAYAAGNLPEAFSLVVATHISMCDACRASLESLNAVGGAVLEGHDNAGEQVDFDAVMAAIDVIGQDPIEVTHKARGMFPSVLQDYVGGDLDAVEWRSVGMGVRQAILPTARDASVRLLHIPAGCAVPDHGHRGTELTLVMQGAFHDDVDHFARGDIEIADEDLNHTPVAAPGEDCICLAATDAPLKFSGLIPKLAQPFLRI